MKKAKITALCGMITAISVVLMLASTLLPVLMYVLPIVTSIGVLLVSEFAGKKWAFGVYFSTAVLSMILLTDKETALTYTMFFGYYPIIKSLFEKLPRILSRVLKTIVFNLAAVGIGFLGVWLFGVSGEEYTELGKFTIPLLLILANVTFIMYDYAISKNYVLIERIVRKIKEKMRIK